MHILELPSFFTPLGGEFCLEQAKALKSQGHEVRILTLVQLGIKSNRENYISQPWGTHTLEMDGVEVIRRFQRDFPRLIHLNMERYCHTVMGMFRKYVDQYGMPDILHVHCPQWAGVAAMRINRRFGVPYIITNHISSGIYHAAYGEGWSRCTWAKEVIKESLDNAAHVIPVARELIDDLDSYFGHDFTWTEVSNIIDTDFFHFQEREPLEGRPFRFCCLGIANEYHFHCKGYDVLLEAFGQMQGAELHIAGRETDGEMMRRMTKNMTNVHLHGHLDRHSVRSLLYQCDALVLASRSEVQPLVLLEAMATGIPVVSTEVTPSSERLPGGCLIAHTGDADDLHRKMQKCMSIAPSKELSAAVAGVASPETVVKELEKIMKNAIG